MEANHSMTMTHNLFARFVWFAPDVDELTLAWLAAAAAAVLYCVLVLCFSLVYFLVENLKLSIWHRGDIFCVCAQLTTWTDG